MTLPKIQEKKRLQSPTVTPQALAWDGNAFWVSSRDLGTLHKVRAGRAAEGDGIDELESVEEIKPPGIIWAAVATNGSLYLTIGEGRNDDRYVYRYSLDGGFSKLFACPEFTGSYLSFDGENLYLSQWYEQRILKLDSSGKIVRKINIGAEICGHTFVDGSIYVLRGTENVPRPAYASGPAVAAKFKNGAKPGEERWWIARLNPDEEKPNVEDVAVVPFAARSLTFDGKTFWSNHRAANETVCFSLPN